MPTFSYYLTTKEGEKLKRTAEKKGITPYRLSQILVKKGLRGIEQGTLEKGAKGTGGTSGRETESTRDWRDILKPDRGKPHA